MLSSILKFFKDDNGNPIIKDLNDLNNRKIKVSFSVEKENYGLLFIFDINQYSLSKDEKTLTFPMLIFKQTEEDMQIQVSLFSSGGFQLTVFKKDGQHYFRKYNYYSEVNYSLKDKLIYKASIKLLPK